MNLRRISKAIAGFLAPGAAVIAEAMWDDKHGTLPTEGEWKIAALVAVVGFIGVYAAPKNREA